MKKNLYSDWREDLREVMNDPSAESETDTKSERSVKDKKVSNKVVINPPMKEAFEEIGGVVLSLHEADMSGAPSIKDKDAPHKKIKKINVKYDPHMKIMAPTIKAEERLTKQDLEKMQDEKDRKETRKPSSMKEDLGNLQLKRAKEERKIAMIDMRIANERKKVERGKLKKSETSDMDQQSQQVKEVLDLKKDDMGDVIKDFRKSDAPQFKGKSKEKKRQMAIAAKLGAMEEGSLNPFQVHFDKDGKEYTSKGSKKAVDRIKKNISSNRKKGPMKYDPYKGTDGRD